MRAILQLHGEVRSAFATLKVVPPNKVSNTLCEAFIGKNYFNLEKIIILENHILA